MTGVMRLFKDVFGPKPNKRNLRKFFKLEVIQQLWFSSSGFSKSNELRDILEELTKENRGKMVYHFTKVQPAGTPMILGD